MSEVMQTLSQALGRLNARERRLIVLAAAVIGAAALWAFAEWSLNERERLAARVPQAHAELARMQADAAQLNDLATRRAPVWPARDEAARMAVAAADSVAIALEVERLGAQLRISGHAPLPSVLSVIANLQADAGLRPVRATLVQEAAGTRFEIDLVAATP